MWKNRHTYTSISMLRFSCERTHTLTHTYISVLWVCMCMYVFIILRASRNCCSPVYVQLTLNGMTIMSVQYSSHWQVNDTPSYIAPMQLLWIEDRNIIRMPQNSLRQHSNDLSLRVMHAWQKAPHAWVLEHVKDKTRNIIQTWFLYSSSWAEKTTYTK